jgi:hypothetical protein
LSPELDAKLRANYPLIFTVEPMVDPDDPGMPALPSSLATWGFECGDGWYELIDALCLNLQHATKHGAPQVVATQVKEKFGALGFHTRGSQRRTGGHDRAGRDDERPALRGLRQSRQADQGRLGQRSLLGT